MPLEFRDRLADLFGAAGPKLRPKSSVTRASCCVPAWSTSTRAYSGSIVPLAGVVRSSNPHIGSPVQG